MADRNLRVFLCHSSQDKPVVRDVYARLKSEGWIDPWFDEKKLLPGSDWFLETEKAIESADAVIVFLSHSSITKEGFVQREIKYALDIADEKPEGTVYIIPLRLEDSPIPRSLKNIQWVNYFDNKSNAYNNLLKSLESRAETLDFTNLKIKANYDLDEVHRLLQNLSKDELQELCFVQFNKSVYSRIDWQDYSYKAINEIIRVAAEQEKTPDILLWIQKHNPKEYKYFLSRTRNSQAQTQSELKKSNKSRHRENPYIPTKPLPENSGVFWGRLDIAKRIANEMRSGGQKPSFLLYGRRRMGKTSALYNLQRLLGGKSTIDILFSGQSAKLSSDAGFCYHLVQETTKRIKDSLLIKHLFNGEEKYADISAFNSEPVILLESFLENCYDFLEKNDLYILIMIDEYEELGKNLSRQLLVQLRNTIQHSRRYIFVFSGASLIDDLPNSAWSEVFVNVTTLPISFLEKGDGYKLLTEPIPDISYESDSIINEILHLTGCQPFLIQCLAYEIVDNLLLNNRFVVRRRDLDAAINKIFSSRAPYFEGIVWRDECSTIRHKEVLRIVATAKNKIKTSDLGDFKAEITDLVKKDIFTFDGEYIKLCVPLIGLWVKQNKFI